MHTRARTLNSGVSPEAVALAQPRLNAEGSYSTLKTGFFAAAAGP